MKIDITFEHEDLIKQITNILAVRGMKPAGEITFRKEKTKPDRYSIRVACETADPPATCMTCGGSLIQQTVPADEGATMSSKDTTPRHYRVLEEEKSVPVKLDEDLGESLAPPQPEDGALPGEGGAVPSIASLRAQSEAIQKQKEREQANRKRGPKAMPGESHRPPTPGEGK